MPPFFPPRPAPPPPPEPGARLNPTIRGALIPRLLQERPWQLVELADRLGVSMAQLPRDLAAVRAAGWDIEEEQGYHAGRIPKVVWIERDLT